MAIQTNFPAIKPSLLLDFENTKQLDPRITFTRASEGRYYDGKTFSKAEENLLLQSQNYSATWTVTNLTPVTGKTAPDSTSTATEFTAGAANAVLTQGYTAIAGSYTFSVWLRRVTGTGDIQIASDNGTWTTKALTGTWARYDVTQTVAAGSKTAGVRVVTSGDVIEIWGAQLEQRSSVTAYTATTTQPITNYVPVLLTAPAGVARFDHNPTTGESLGLLIEEQRTNLLTYSEQFDNAVWTKTNATVTANTVVAPDGTLTADALIETTATGEHRVQVSATVVSGASYTISVYVKAVNETRNVRILQFQSSSPFTNFGAFVFNPTNGSAISGSGTVQAVGNGWYRVSVSGTAPTTGATIRIELVSGTSTFSYTGDGTSGIYIWGAQLEDGAFPTSYIPTVASQVTRSADAASMTGTNFSSWYRQDEGSFYSEVQLMDVTSTNINTIYAANADANNHIRGGRRVGGGGIPNNQLLVVSGGATSAFIQNVSAFVSTGVFSKSAGAYKVNDFAQTTSGVTVGTDADGVLPSGISTLGIGSSSSTHFLNGTIRKLAYYPARLSNANLQALTS